MHLSVELQHLDYQIQKATVRLAYQQVFVQRLGVNAVSSEAKIAKDVLTKMERHLYALLENHAALLNEQTSPTRKRHARSLRSTVSIASRVGSYLS